MGIRVEKASGLKVKVRGFKISSLGLMGLGACFAT